MAAASYALAGRDAEARKILARYLQLDPTRRISNLRETLGAYRHEMHMAQYENALRLAGLPAEAACPARAEKPSPVVFAHNLDARAGSS